MVTWACEKFTCYVLGTTFKIESDRQPLIPLLSNKQLHKLPPHSYTIQHVPGKLLYTANTLLQTLLLFSTNDAIKSDEVEHFVLHLLPASSGRLQVLCCNLG